MSYNLDKEDKRRALYTGREISAACAAITALVGESSQRYTFKEIITLASIHLVAALKSRDVEVGRDLNKNFKPSASAPLYELSDPLQAIDAGVDDLPGSEN